MPLDTAVTERAARILIERDPGPGDRLDAFLLLAGQEYLCAPTSARRSARPAPPEARVAPLLRRGQAAAHRASPGSRRLARGPLPRLAVQPRWPGPRFRHGLASDGPSLSICLGLPYETALKEPPRSLPHAERRVTELALANVVDPGVEGVAREPHG